MVKLRPLSDVPLARAVSVAEEGNISLYTGSRRLQSRSAPGEKWGCGEGALGRTALQTERRRISTALTETRVKPLQGARHSTAAAMKGTTDSVSLDDAIWSQVMPRARLWVRGEPRGVGGPGAPLAGAGRAGSHPAPGMAPPASPELVPL